MTGRRGGPSRRHGLLGMIRSSVCVSSATPQTFLRSLDRQLQLKSRASSFQDTVFFFAARNFDCKTLSVVNPNAVLNCYSFSV